MHGQVAETQKRAHQRCRGQRIQDLPRQAEQDVDQRLREPVVAATYVVQLPDELDARKHADEHRQGRGDPAKQREHDVAAQQRHVGASRPTTGLRAKTPD